MSFSQQLSNGIWAMVPRRLLTWIELRLLINYKRDPWEQEGLGIVRDIYAQQSSLLEVFFRGATTVLFSPGELLNLWIQARCMRDHGGAFAEVGAFKGDSAEVVCKVKGDREFYVFEAFAGLRAAGSSDGGFRQGMFASDEACLRSRLSRYPKTTVIAGYFPDTAAPIAHLQFSYVHLDVDLYEDTLAALRFFYPRMLRGGRIISHDYGQCEGVWRAFDEFFEGMPESVEPFGATQVLVVKT